MTQGLLNENLKFDVGDVVTSTDKTSDFFRRDCIVVHSDIHFVALISDGIKYVCFKEPKDPSIIVVRRGRGALTEEQRLVLLETMKHWEYVGFLKGLAKNNVRAKRNLNVESDEKIWVQINGFVSKPLAVSWKQLCSLIDCARETVPDMDNKVKEHILEWILISTINSIPLQSVKRVLEGEDEGETANMS